MLRLPFAFEATHGAARAGVVTTPHGAFQTPAFMPVATQGSVKTLTWADVRGIGARTVLANTYHLSLLPGVELVRRMGGLHRFTGWDGPILTDSGGFQVFSLGGLRKVEESGVKFRSPRDGSLHTFTPDSVMAAEEALGADIAMAFDHCPPAVADESAAREAMKRTVRWAARCRAAHTRPDQALFGIVQGGVFPALRTESAKATVDLDFDGYAIGGVAVGEDKPTLYRVTAETAPLLPVDRPRYLMGVGAPDDLVECVAAGVDMFDCALPTRVARNGGLFTPEGRVDITATRWRDVDLPLDASCDCPTCATASCAYLHHLYKAREVTALRLGTVHNLRFVLRLMEEARRAIIQGRFQVFREAFHTRYRPTDEAARVRQKDAWMRARGILEG